MAKDRLIYIENDIKKLVAADKKDPRVFTRIQELVYKYLLRNRVFPGYDTAREASYDIAEYLYLRLLEGHEIQSWIGYIKKIYPGFYTSYMNRQTEIIDTSNDIDLANAVVRMISASTMDDDSIDQIYVREYLRSIPKIVEETLRESHFFAYTPEYLNARLSLLLSIAQDKYVSYNLNEADSAYVKLLYKVLCTRIMHEIKSDKKEHIEPVQFYLLDTNENESSNDKWESY